MWQSLTSLCWGSRVVTFLLEMQGMSLPVGSVTMSNRVRERLLLASQLLLKWGFCLLIFISVSNLIQLDEFVLSLLGYNLQLLNDWWCWATFCIIFYLNLDIPLSFVFFWLTYKYAWCKAFFFYRIYTVKILSWSLWLPFALS